MNVISIIGIGLIAVSSGMYFNAENIKDTLLPRKEVTELSEFSWVGRWGFNIGHIVMSVDIYQDGTKYKGRHCMVDGRIHGGANDCATFLAPDVLEYTLTNSKVIDDHTLEFDFESGYTATSGKARLIKVDDATIRFIVTEDPHMFPLSPLSNFLFLNDGKGEDATGGIYLTKYEPTEE